MLEIESDLDFLFSDDSNFTLRFSGFVKTAGGQIIKMIFFKVNMLIIPFKSIEFINPFLKRLLISEKIFNQKIIYFLLQAEFISVVLCL